MSLFDEFVQSDEALSPGAILLRGFASGIGDAILSGLHGVVREAPFCQVVTLGSWRMSVAMTNCESLGCIAATPVYRYGSINLKTGHPWPNARIILTARGGVVWGGACCHGRQTAGARRYVGSWPKADWQLWSGNSKKRT